MSSGEEWKQDERTWFEPFERSHGAPERQHGVVSHAVGHDELTGLPNGRLFATIAPALIDEGRPAVTLVVALNGFHSFGKLFGQGAGDEMLCVLARRLTDSAGDELVARLDGDQFAAVLISPAPAASRQWWRSTVAGLWATLTAPVRVRGRALQPTASIGVASVRDGLPISELLRRAEQAQCRARAGGQPYAVWELDAADDGSDACTDERTIEFTLVPAVRHNVAA